MDTDAFIAGILGLDPTGKIGPASYRAIRNKVYALAKPFRFSYGMQYAIYAAIRNRLGRRITELREADVPQVWAVLAEIEPVVARLYSALADVERNAIKKVFGPAGVEAVEGEARKAMAKLEAVQIPEAPVPPGGGNVIRFPGAA